MHDFYSHLTTIDELYCHNIVNNQRIVTWAHFLWVLTCYSWWLKVYGISLVNIWIDESNSAFFIAFIECWKEHYCVNFKLVFWTVEHVNESDSESDFRALVNLISLVKRDLRLENLLLNYANSKKSIQLWKITCGRRTTSKNDLKSTAFPWWADVVEGDGLHALLEVFRSRSGLRKVSPVRSRGRHLR